MLYQLRFCLLPVEVNHIHNIERISCVARDLAGNVTLLYGPRLDAQRIIQHQEKEDKVMNTTHLSAGYKYLSL